MTGLPDASLAYMDAYQHGTAVSFGKPKYVCPELPPFLFLSLPLLQSLNHFFSPVLILKMLGVLNGS